VKIVVLRLLKKKKKIVVLRISFTLIIT